VGIEIMTASTYLSDDRHEIRLINILLDVLKFWLFGIRIRIMINERHEAFAIFLRQDVLHLSHAGLQINIVPERVDVRANGSFLVETISHVLERKSTVAHVGHELNPVSIRSWIGININATALQAQPISETEGPIVVSIEALRSLHEFVDAVWGTLKGSNNVFLVANRATHGAFSRYF